VMLSVMMIGCHQTCRQAVGVAAEICRACRLESYRNLSFSK